MVKAGEDLGPDTLTVNERVLLHLRESGTARDAVDAFPLTQPGIADTLGIRVNHVSRAVKHLIDHRLLAEGTTMLRGEVRNRKVYTVTPEGHALAQRLAAEVARRRVVAVDASGERALAASEAKRLIAPPTLTHLLATMDAEGRVDLRRPASPSARDVARFEEGRPAPQQLLGREADVLSFREWLDEGPTVLAVIGPKGIGKSAFVSACIDDSRPRFWWSVRDGDSPAALLGGLGTFLADLGKGELRARVADEVPEWRQAAKILARDLKAANAFLVLDDLEAASRELVPYLNAIIESVPANGCRIAVLSEEPLPARSTLLAEGRLRELRLRGLDRAAARALLPRTMLDPEFEKVYRLTEGNPLSLKLLAAEDTPGGYSPEERALLKVLRMRQDEG
ncbi:MAG: hypothetical protein E6K18_00345 [Methanobacteriota archaeon]|nr:MAG: hypothetical protein E6K18_00345 [Euryarchaeota archaeon]